MKHKLLVPIALAFGFTGLAQTNRSAVRSKIKPGIKQADFFAKLKREDNPASKSRATQAVSPASKTSNVTVFTWTNIAQSMNMYGFLNDGQKPLHYNPYVNAVSFIHRKSGTYVASPDNNSGAMVAEISGNWGTTWDSTCIYSDGTNLSRYPQGAIYSAPGNTSLSNAYVVGSGVSLDAGGSNWTGGWFASKQLGAGNYNNGASSAPNAMQVLFNTPPYPAAVGKVDYPIYSFASTSDGKVHSLGYVCDDINSATNIGLRGSKLLTGTFNAGVFNWTADSIVENLVKRSDSSGHIGYTPIMAWSQDGTIGYVITIGVKANAVGSNRGYQPIIRKTTNSGASWSLINGIDFSSPTFSNVLKHLDPVANSTVVVPQFNSGEGIDAAVDANGKLHIAATIISTPSSDIDSLDSWEPFTTEEYHWDYTPGKKPYLYDFYGDGTAAWNYVTVDSLTSEGPGDQSGTPGYLDNQWQGDGSYKARSDSRIELSRTPDGNYIVYTWAESNPAFTIGSKNWNNLPDVKARIMDIPGGYYVSPTKINITPVGTAVNNKATFHFAAPVVSAQTHTSSTSVTFTVPLTVSNSMSWDDLSDITHWYTKAALNFTLLTPVGINENSATESNLSVYPNPTKDNTTLTIDLKENTHVDVVIYDVVGKQMKHIATNGNIGANNITLDMNGFAKGIYFVNVKVGNSNNTRKVVVE